MNEPTVDFMHYNATSAHGSCKFPVWLRRYGRRRQRTCNRMEGRRLAPEVQLDAREYLHLMTAVDLASLVDTLAVGKRMAFL